MAKKGRTQPEQKIAGKAPSKTVGTGGRTARMPGRERRGNQPPHGR